MDGNLAKCLLDTGATVSTISRKFFNSHLSHIPVVAVSELLTVEVAGGYTLPFDGYAVIDFNVPFDNKTHTALFLIVPDTTYNEKVPVLIGTNILSMFLTSAQQEQDFTGLPQVWSMALRVVRDRDSWFQSHSGLIGVGKCCDKITLQPNSQAVVDCVVDGGFNYAGAALAEESPKADLPSGVHVEPLLFFCSPQSDTFPVGLSNTSSQTVVLSPGKICCEVQMARVAQKPDVVEDSSLDIDLDFDDIDTDLTQKQRAVALDFVQSWRRVFSTGDLDIGCTSAVQHEIKLMDDTPFKQRYRRIPPAVIEEVRLHLQQLQDAGVIRPSSSPYASNLVLVRKKDNSLRICIDYRMLNAKTIRDAYAIPRISEMFDYLGGYSMFSVLDMKSGYFQVPLKEADIPKTAFTCGSIGHFEYTRMPFGLTNSPATYQRLMENVFKDLNHKCCLIYLDDLIVYSRSFEEHLLHLEAVFKQLQAYNLKLAPKKCKLFRKRVKYLGHIVSAEGISVDPEKTEKVSSWPAPENHKQLHQFLGFAGYYRRYIKDYSKITKPLTELLAQSNKDGSKAKSSWNWTTAHEQAFGKVKELLTSAPILAVPDPAKPYELHVDSSAHSLGAVLYQEIDGLPRVIAYASRTMNSAEQRYPTHKREFLALKWAVTEQFHEYLYGAKCIIFTDNNPLTWVLSTARVDATGQRWLANLAAYQFEIRYKPGKKNNDADGLSRIPLSSNVVQAVCNNVHVPYVDSLAISIDCDDMIDCDFSPTQLRFWRQAQRNDAAIAPLFPFVQDGKRPQKTAIPAASYGLLKEFERLKLIRGGMYRVCQIDGKEERRLVLPSCFKKTVLHLLHDDMGHQGRDRTKSLVQERFYWPHMGSEIEEYVRSCPRCISRKTTGEKAQLVPILTSQPLEVVAMDFLSLEVSKGGFQHILVITDLFTRYAVAVPTKNLSAKTTALAFYNHFVVHYGFPGRIHSDGGGSFENKIIHELCKITGMQKSRTSPYHPAGNGMTERFNSSLLNMLGTLDPSIKAEWSSRVASVVHAYNCTPHSVTQVSPYFLMFGRHPNLPLDVVMNLQRNADLQSSALPQYVKNLRNSLKHAYEAAKISANSGHVKQKELYDMKARAAILDVGDRVLVRKLGFQGKHKIADRWESAVYVVSDQPNKDIPVYIVTPEGGTSGIKRTLHRNQLLPIGTMRRAEGESRVSHARQKRKSFVPVVTESNSESEGASSEDNSSVRAPSFDDSAGPVEPSGNLGATLDRNAQADQVDESVSEESSADDAGDGLNEPRYPSRDRRAPDRYGDNVYSQVHSHKVVHANLHSTSHSRPKQPSRVKSSGSSGRDEKLALLTKMLDFLK